MDLDAFLAAHGLNSLNGKIPFASADQLRSLFPEGDTLDQLQLLGLEERKLKRAVETLPFQSNLPTPLALSLKEFHLCTSGAESLWMACNFLEIVLKFCFAAAIAERTEACGALAMPESLVDLIGRHLEAPGLGEWLELTQAAVTNDGAWISCTSLQRALFNTVEKVRVLKEEQKMWETRNRLAHGGWFRKSPVEVDIWRTPFLDFVEADLKWLERVELVAGAGGKVWYFRGETASVHYCWNHRLRGAINNGICRIISREHKADLDISPFAATSPSAPVPLMYSRWKSGCIEYISYGGLVEWVKEPNQLNNRSFRENFFRPSFKWLPTPFSDFREKEKNTISETTSCQSLANSVRHRLKEGSGGVIWLGGLEGSGKSTIMADLARRRIGQPDKALTFAYRFESGSFLNRSECFLHYVHCRLSLADWKPGVSKWSVSKGPNKPFDANHIVSTEDILDLFKEKTTDPLSMMLFVVDGIDDICAKDSTFLDKVLFPLTKESRILFIVSGIQGTPVAEQFRKSGAFVFFSEGLPPLTLREFTSVLCTACGDSSTKMLDLQTQAERESYAFADRTPRFAGEEGGRPFGFLAEAHRKGGGSPLYATYLAEDLRSGVVKIGDIAVLPSGIKGYHNLHLERMGVLGMLISVPSPILRAGQAGFIAAVEQRSATRRDVEGWNIGLQPTDDYLARASVLALMAADSAPITTDQISERLGQTVLRGHNLHRRNLDDRESDGALSIVDRALEAVSPLLKIVPIDETGTEGFSLASPSIRRHLNSLEGVRQMARRFGRHPDDSATRERRDPRLLNEVILQENHWKDQAEGNPSEERPNTLEIEARIAVCISHFESLKRCLEVSEFYIPGHISWFNDYYDPARRDPEDGELCDLADSHVSELIPFLRWEEGFYGWHNAPSVAFRAIQKVETVSDLKLSNWLRDAPTTLRGFTWSEPLLSQLPSRFSHEDGDHYREHFKYYVSDYYGKTRYQPTVQPTLISCLDWELNMWVRRVNHYTTDGVSVRWVGTAKELEIVCCIAAEILELVRDGADLSRIDAYPVAVVISMTQKSEDALARLRCIQFRFRDLPAEVLLS